MFFGTRNNFSRGEGKPEGQGDRKLFEILKTAKKRVFQLWWRADRGSE